MNDAEKEARVHWTHSRFIVHMADCEICHTAHSNVYAAESEGLPQDYCDAGRALYSACNIAQAESTPPPTPNDDTPF